MNDSSIITQLDPTNQSPLPRTREWYQQIGRRGGQARAAMPNFRQHQSHAGKRSAQVNDMAALGSLGAKAFIRKYGYIKFFHFWRNWKLQNPSRHEQQVALILDHQREAMVLGANIPVAVDFYLPDVNDSIIEVNGRVHYDPFFDHPNYPQTRRDNDLARLRRLERAGFRVLEIDYRMLQNLAAAKTKIIGFLIN
ncbi:MAG: endonuclease domain-containing protein [Anaerolineae bacterium]|nr:endonuclease domain-containing protein [Anaerolineae bacterium]